MAALFTAEHISKSFHLRAVLRDVSLALHAGETILLFGRNGTGKTTLLRILAGIMRPEQGRASLDGQALFTSDSRWRRDMVYLGHRANLYPDLTARENLALCLRLRKQVWDENGFSSAMRRHGLYDWRDQLIRIYSEGMLQRLGLVRLIMSRWRLALLDEPSSALDVEGMDLLAEALTGWHSEGRTVLLTSHHHGWGAAQADRALLLAGGCISEELADPGREDLVRRMRGERT